MQIQNRTVTAPSPLLNGLMGYWKMEEATNQTDSLGVNDLTVTGTVYTQQTGKLNYGVAFNDVGRGIFRTPGSFYYGTIQGELTISFWLKLNALPSVQGHEYYIFYGSGLSGGENSPIQVYISNSSDRMVFRLAGYNDVLYTSLSNVITNITSFFHVALVTNGISGDMRIYFDNVDVTSTVDTLDTFIKPFNNYITIGNTGNGNTSALCGTLDELCFYSRSLSTSEISMLYNSGSGITYPFS